MQKRSRPGVTAERRQRGWRVFLIALAVAVFAAGVYLHRQYVPPILMYHRIDGHSATSALSVSPESFARQMGLFHRLQYRVVPLNNIVQRVLREEVPERGEVALTFDDGFESVYTQAYPVLRQYGMPATIFIVTDWVGTPGYMTWDQIRELAAHGFEVGCHTKSHPWLPAVDDEWAGDEVITARRIIRQQVPSATVRFFSYPMGAYNAHIKRAVQDAGYVAACATNPGRRSSWRDLFALKRLRISRSSDNPFVFWIETSGYYTWMKEHRGKHLWHPKPVE